MTLILSALTRDYVVQVSDRRLTDANTGAPLDETANKAIVFCGHFVFGYTGVAKIDSTRTDMWLAERLLAKGASAQANLEHVRDEATRAFERIPPRYRRHAFIGVGWTRSKPAISVISNYIDENGRELDTAQDEFRLHNILFTGSKKSWLIPVGQRIPEAMLSRFRRAVRRIASRGGPIAMAEVLVRQLWRIADENDRVSHDAMVSVIPRAAVPVGAIVIPSAPNKKSAAFYYVASAGETAPRMYMPMSACGGVAVGGGEAWFGAIPPWWKE